MNITQAVVKTGASIMLGHYIATKQIGLPLNSKTFTIYCLTAQVFAHFVIKTPIPHLGKIFLNAFISKSFAEKATNIQILWKSTIIAHAITNIAYSKLNPLAQDTIQKIRNIYLPQQDS
jgi:hypothetical protein